MALKFASPTPIETPRSMLVNDPEECIDCRLCVPECPVNASRPGEEVPGDQEVYFEINERFADCWPVITCKRPIAGNEEWVKTEPEAHLFDPESAN